MKIGIHQLIYNVHVVEVLSSWGTNDVCNGNDLLQAKKVVKFLCQEIKEGAEFQETYTVQLES